MSPFWMNFSLVLGGIILGFIMGYNARKAEQKEPPPFLDAIEAVCREHGLSISHEDSHGAFLIVPLNDDDIAWLRAAQKETR